MVRVGALWRLPHCVTRSHGSLVGIVTIGPLPVDRAPSLHQALDRRALIRRAAAAGAAAWTAPLVIESLASPAGAVTGGGVPPAGGVPITSCSTVASQTVVSFSVGTGYQFTGTAVSTSCVASIGVTSTSGNSVTLSFPKQTLHHVYLLVESVPAGDCFLYVYDVTSPNPNGRPCNVRTLVGSAVCQTPTLVGATCTPTRVEP